MLTLHLKQAPPVAVDLRGVLPGRRQTLAELAAQSVGVGNQRARLGDLFTLNGSADSREWTIEGDCANVHHLGASLAGGAIAVTGSVGRHCGAGMLAGRIEVHGSAGDWLGAEMRGGEIHVRGDAGRCVGGGYTGSKHGMRGGAIVVHGRVGDQAGRHMRRGVLLALGGCGELAGFRMRAGSLIALGPVGANPGLEMLRGTIALVGGGAPPVTFGRACCLESPLLALLRSTVARLAGPAAAGRVPSHATLYNGDLLRGGRGELLLTGPLPL